MQTEKSRNRTLDYYEQNAKEFAASTAAVDFQKQQEHFLQNLPAGAKILDFGCGSGRDTKYFLERGYKVTAMDGSFQMCQQAEKYTGISVRHMMFQELEEVECYDGIWACASMLHLTFPELEKVLKKTAAALKSEGILYMSFKYGTFEGERNGRYFTDMTEEILAKVMEKTAVYHIQEQWISRDVRPEKAKEKWLNVILRKRSV